MTAAVFSIVLDEIPDQAPDQAPSAPGDAQRAEGVERAVAEYEDLLTRYAFGFLSDWEQARDAVQDTFFRLDRELRSRSLDNPKAWLFTVCRNRALDILRKNQRMSTTDDAILAEVPDEGDSGPGEALAVREEYEKAMAYLKRLPANQQEVVRLKFQADLSYKEISDITGLSVGNVGYLLHHALKRLRELMQTRTP